MSREEEEDLPNIDCNITSGTEFEIKEKTPKGEEEPLTPSSTVSLNNEEVFEQEEVKKEKIPPSPATSPSEGNVCEICKYTFTKDRIDKEREYVFKIPSRYEPIRIIGEGAYGFVVSALDKQRNQKVAIKVIRNVFSRSRAFQKRILREIMLLKHFRNHDNIINLYDLFAPVDYDSFNDIYIVTDLMDTDLSKLIRGGKGKKRNKLNERHIQYIIYEILKGLKYVHSANVLHRDIKPSNILLNKEMEVKLCDFGLSRGIDFDVRMSTHYVVTRWYRSPELLCMWEKTSKSIDLWSVGCILGEILSRQPNPKDRVLFRGNGWVDQLKKIVEKRGMPKEEEIHGTLSSKKYIESLRGNGYKKQPLKDLFPEASTEILEFLDELLEFDPEKRLDAEHALQHPYFKKLYQEDLEHEEDSLNPCTEPFVFRFDESNTQTSDIKRILFDIVMRWNEQNHNYSRIFESEKVVHVKVKNK